MDVEDEIQGMEIPDRFRIQASAPAGLDSSSLQHGLLVEIERMHAVERE